MTEPLPAGQTLQDAMDALSKQVAAARADVADLDRQRADRERWRRELYLRSAPIGGLNLIREPEKVGEGRGSVFVVEKVRDWWHGDLWRVECMPPGPHYGPPPACHGCGRTAVVRGDDFRLSRVQSCHDFEQYGVTEEATT